jgi:twitching motility two-component system response regulator PilH
MGEWGMAFELFKRIFGSNEPGERRRGARLHGRHGLRVLVIDDSATIVAVLGKMLRQNGYDVLKAGDAESGLEIARAERPDLIFLDIVLPGMNGFAALRLLRREASTQQIPVIMISGNMQATEQFYAQRIGADDFMKKPFGRDEVFTRVQRLIESGRLVPRSDDEAPITPPPDEPADIPDIAMPDPSDLAAGAGAGTTAPTVTERPDV